MIVSNKLAQHTRYNSRRSDSPRSATTSSCISCCARKSSAWADALPSGLSTNASDQRDGEQRSDGLHSGVESIRSPVRVK